MSLAGRLLGLRIACESPRVVLLRVTGVSLRVACTSPRVACVSPGVACVSLRVACVSLACRLRVPQPRNSGLFFGASFLASGFDQIFQRSWRITNSTCHCITSLHRALPKAHAPCRGRVIHLRAGPLYTGAFELEAVWKPRCADICWLPS